MFREALDQKKKLPRRVFERVKSATEHNKTRVEIGFKHALKSLCKPLENTLKR